MPLTKKIIKNFNFNTIQKKRSFDANTTYLIIIWNLMNQTHLFMLLASNKWVVSNLLSVQHVCRSSNLAAHNFANLALSKSYLWKSIIPFLVLHLVLDGVTVTDGWIVGISSILWSSNSQIEGFKFSHTIGETEYIYIHTRKLTNLGFVRDFVTWYHKKATH